MRTLTAGAFAKLCHVPKGTILFYDRAGLLKPAHVEANGYRRYGIEQYYTFSLIRLLKMSGCSLEEIRKHLRCMDGPDFLAFLRARERALRTELAELRRKKVQLQDMADCLEEALSMSYDKVELAEAPEERLEIWPTGASLEDSEETAVYRMRRYNEFLESQKGIPRQPHGEVLSVDAAAEGKFLELAYFQRARRESAGARLHVKPAGLYAVMGHNGTFLSHGEAVKKMITSLYASGHIIDSSVYAYDMVGYMVKNDEECFRIKYCVRILDHQSGAS